MQLVFIDETSDTKFKDYFGISCCIINSHFYKTVKSDFQSILLKEKWDPNIEFKGSYLFSASKGDRSISIEKRVLIAKKILRLNVSVKHSRMKFYYLAQKSKDQRIDYLAYLPLFLDKILPKPKHTGSKDVICIQCDNRNDISNDEIRNSLLPVINKNGYTLLENVIQANSNFETVGLLYADIVGYLTSRIETISNDVELFDNIPEDQLMNNGKIKKLTSSIELIRMIKSLNRFQVKV